MRKTPRENRGTVVRPIASPMRTAPTKPAAGSSRGSRLVTTSATRSQITAAAPKTARLPSRSRASTAESLTIGGRRPDLARADASEPVDRRLELGQLVDDDVDRNGFVGMA